jgi:hypothetical protein
MAPEEAIKRLFGGVGLARRIELLKNGVRVAYMSLDEWKALGATKWCPLKRGSRHLWEGAMFTASNLLRLAQRVALQTRGLQPEGPCSERPMIEDTTRRSAGSRRSAIGCQRIQLWVEVTQLSSSLSRIVGFVGLHTARE